MRARVLIMGVVGLWMLVGVAHGAGEDIWHAAATGDVAMVKELLGKGVNPNGRDGGGLMPLHLAAAGGNAEVVEALLEGGANVRGGDKAGWSPLHWAAARGNVEVVRLLLERGGDVHAKGGPGPEAMPLHKAARWGHVEVARMLLEWGANVNVKLRRKHWRPLGRAIMSGNLEMVRLLLERGAKVNVPDESFSFDTPLHGAAKQGNLAMVRLLLEHGADVNLRFKGGTSLFVLHHAARQKSPEIARLLLEHGAEVNVRTGWEETPLHGAMGNVHFTVRVREDGGVEVENDPVARDLIQHGADVNARDDAGDMPLHWWAGWAGLSEALSAGVKLETESGEVTLDRETVLGIYTYQAQLLLDHGADVNAVNKARVTPLRKAAWRGDIEAVKFLLERGAEYTVDAAIVLGDVAGVEKFLAAGTNVNAQLRGGRFLLHWAAKRGNVEVVRLLLERGAKVNVREATLGLTPLHLAVMGGDLEMAKLLLGHDADPNIGNAETPLHLAAHMGKREMVELLLGCGAKVGTWDRDRLSIRFALPLGGWTPLHRAAEEGNVQVAELLLSSGGKVNAKGKWGVTPLMVAAACGQAEMAEFLIRKGADVNVKGETDWTALHAAAGQRGLLVESKEIWDFVVASRQKREAGHTEEWSWEIWPSVGVSYRVKLEPGHHMEVVRLLLEHGAKTINDRTKEGWTPLRLAVRLGDVEMVRLLLEHGAEMRWAGKGTGGKTALHFAVDEGRAEVVELLLKEYY